MKKFLLCLLLILLILSFVGCSADEGSLSINPQINEYTPAISSTPGIEVIAVFSQDLKNKDLKYHWMAEQGTFLMWHDQGKGWLKDLGSDIKTNVHKVYWSVNQGEAIKEKAFKIYLTIENTQTSEVLAETSIQIRQDIEGYFTID